MRKSYDYFISYASENLEWARSLRSMLPQTSSVFFAEEVAKGKDWEVAIRRAVAETRNFVVLLSKASANATYQRAEVDLALRASEVDPHMRITPVCVGIADDDLPLGLNLKQAIAISSSEGLRDAVAQLLKQSAESDTEVLRNVGSLVIELEQMLVEKHNAPHTLAWGHNAGPGGSGTSRNVRIAELSNRITSQFQPRAGATVAGGTLIKIIGQGGFADVWEASGRDGSPLAVKVLRLGLLQKDLTLWRFRRGAAALARLGERKRRKRAAVEPGCVMDLLEVDESELAYAMPLMSRGSLDAIATFGWSLEQKLRAFDQVCSAVQYAHEQTIIHRDIKPGNVMVNDHLQPVLTDFDIADIGLATQFSTTVGGLGTPVFAAPEQLLSANQATERSDIFSLGRLLHFMLLERSPGPYVGESDLDNLANFEHALVEVVRRCCQRQPAERFTNVGELRHALSSHQRLVVRWRVASLRVMRLMRRYSPMLMVLSAVAIAVIAVGVVGLLAYQRSREQQKQLEGLFESYTALDARQAVARAKQDSAIAASRDLREQIEAKEKEVQMVRATLPLAQTAGERVFKQETIQRVEGDLAKLRASLAGKEAEIEANIHEVQRFLEAQKQERANIERLRKKVVEPTIYESWLQGYSANQKAEGTDSK